MGKKCITFDPTLHTPVGINNYSGTVFRCFTKGDTLPFRFVVSNPLEDLTDCTMTVIMANDLIADGGCSDDQIILEVDIPLVDLAAGIFEGEVTNIKTQGLPAGLVYAIAKFTEAPTGTIEDPIPGLAYIVDMCQLEVYQNVIFAELG